MKHLNNSLLVMLLLLFSFTLSAATDVPNIKLPGLHGEVELAKLSGKVVYLDFWASWCKPCIKSFPWMKTMKIRYQDQGLEIVAINLDKERKLAEAFLKDIEINFEVAFDSTGDTASLYKLRGMPSSFLIGRDGKLYATHVGFRDKDKPKVEAAIKQLLKL
ncbi:MAG: TlpA family protein disulfide reductase [Gammaproteobacteria bacterium]|nr:TlpA family protein disulfide reductase [Gammaproteobacteria bacterium]